MFAEPLLRAHVIGRAEQGAEPRHAGFWRGSRGLGDLGDAEVEHLADLLVGLVPTHDEDVGRLEIAMNDVGRMGFGHGLGDVTKEVSQGFGGEVILTLESRSERLPFE